MQAAVLTWHESNLGSWEMASREPLPILRPFVAKYAAYREHITGFTRRREVPERIIPIHICLGDTIGIGAAGDPAGETRQYRAFVAGPHDTYALSETGGHRAGIQVNLTLPGARRFLGMPLYELTNRVFEVEDLLGRDGRVLVERLRMAPGWDACFDILDEVISARVCSADGLPGDVAWTLGELGETGRAGHPPRISHLADALGYSHKQLIARFRGELGLTPRTFARITRFEGLLGALKGDGPPRWADLAPAFGYYDQSHLSRDFRDFMGLSPGAFVRRSVADNGGVVDTW